MFKCFFLSSFFFVFAVVNFGVSGFDERINSGGVELNERIPKGNHKKNMNNGKTYNNKGSNSEKNEDDISEINSDKNINSAGVNPDLQPASKDTEILGNKPGAEIRQLVLYYYIAVSFLLYNYKKVDRTIFSELGDKPYKGPVDGDVFAVYKEFSGSDSKGTSTYHDYLSFFCKDALGEFLAGREEISYSDAYKKMYATISDFLSQAEKKISIELGENGWKDESVQWAFTVALQVFAYKKIYEYLNKSNISLEGNNHDPALQHDLVYVKFLSEMMYNIFKNVLESFSSDSGNTIRSRELFFLSGLKPKNIGPGNPKNMFYSAFSNLVFRPAELKGSVRMFLDCFYPIIDRIKRIK